MLKRFSRISKRTLLISSVLILTSFGLARYVFDKNDVILEMLLGNLNQIAAPLLGYFPGNRIGFGGREANGVLVQMDGQGIVEA